jgi:hypothetical protein
MDAETKRAQAKDYTGVSYDARSDRFTAEIWVAGERRWLGSYHTALDASDAYQEARAARPPREPRVNAFMEAYRAFRDRHGGDRTDPPDGAVLEYDGQQFAYTGVTWRSMGKRGRYAFVVWRSRCKECGAEYTTMTPSPVSVAKGVTRNCPEHVGKNPFAKRKAGVAKQPEPLSVFEELAEHLRVLGLSHDRLPIAAVAEFVAARSYRLTHADALSALPKWSAGALRLETECPVEVRDGMVMFPDNPARGLL